MSSSFLLAAGLCERAGAAMVDATVSATLLLASAWIVTAFLRRSSAALRHRIWALTMIALLLLPAMSWVLPAWQIPVLPAFFGTGTFTPTAPASLAGSQPLSDIAADTPDELHADGPASERLPVSDTINPQTVSSIPSGVPADLTSNSAGVSEFPLVPVVSISASRSHAYWVFCLILVWVAGSSLFLVRLVSGAVRLGRIRREARPVTDGDWLRLIGELQSQLRLRRPVRLLHGGESVVPMTWGLVRPVILLPQESGCWPDGLRRSVLLHELAHVKRRDVVFQLFARAACAVYWFHPLAWCGLTQLRREREQACDDWAVNAGVKASDYTAQLLAVARICFRPAGLAGAVEMARANGLERRVVALFDTTRSHSPLGGGVGAISLAGIVAVSVGLTVLEPVPLKASAEQPAESNENGRSPEDLATEAEVKLSQARDALRGRNKAVEFAKRHLTDLAGDLSGYLTPIERCHVLVYLGYIEDRAGNREAAIEWYEKALKVEGEFSPGIRRAAEAGKTRPITFLRHLDRDATAPSRAAAKASVIERIGGAVVMAGPPADTLELKMDLSPKERLENFDVFWEAIDRNFSFFEHKGLDWPEVKERYRPKVEAAETGEDYYRVLYDLVRELKDPHSWLINYGQHLQLPRFSPPISTDRIEGKAVVTSVEESLAGSVEGLQPGAVITHIDGMSVTERIERLRPLMRISSTERNFLKVAHRRLLCGERDSTVRVTLLPPNESTAVEIELVRTGEAIQHRREPGFPVRRGRFVQSGVHPSGCGYIRIASFKGRTEIADEFDEALERLKDTPALVIDIRENPGGYGTSHARIIGRLITERTKTLISFGKTGPGHGDLSGRDRYLSPTGDWQYTKPIALLINEVTGSASDLFACQMLGTGRVLAVGTSTHGNSAGSAVYVQLPCGLTARISNCYNSHVDGRIIEGNGSVPQVPADLTIDDIVNGTDSVLDRAARAVL